MTALRWLVLVFVALVCSCAALHGTSAGVDGGGLLHNLATAAASNGVDPLKWTTWVLAGGIFGVGAVTHRVGSRLVERRKAQRRSGVDRRSAIASTDARDPGASGDL